MNSSTESSGFTLHTSPRPARLHLGRPNTAHKLRGGAPGSARGRTWRHLVLPSGRRHEPRQLHALVLRRKHGFGFVKPAAPGVRLPDSAPSTLDPDPTTEMAR